MIKIIETIRKDSSLFTGLILVFISSLLYAFSYSAYEQYRDAFTPLFFIHYLLAIVYLASLILRSELRLFQLFRGPSRPYHVILLILLNISAYSLNQTLPVFHESVDWLTAFLILENFLLLVYLLVPVTNKTFASVLVFFFTPALIFNIYQAMMILPYTILGIMASPFLGISLHALVPPAYVLALIFILADLIRKGADWKLFAIACSCCSILIGFYVVQWNSINNTVSKTLHHQHVPGTVAELPEWVRLSQTLADNAFTEKALQAGLIYQEFTEWNAFSGAGLRFEESKFHDPLLTIASLTGGKIDLDTETKIKILDAKYNMRHESADRFWSGLNLKTSDIVTNVQLFPSYRLAYTEMIFRIRNESHHRSSRWFGQEEALYTFQLPEGGTVSSLSLWIEGKEAKARLTTRAKAEKAYNTIVGREARDPSVVYWMEGNKIRVRVFPCTPEEDRQFKIGVTSPLSFAGNRLKYENITFKGPDFGKAKASVNVLIQQSKEAPASSLRFEKNGNTYSWEGTYKPGWHITTKALPLSAEPFRFQGIAYAVEELKPAFTAFSPDYIYLDFHAGWSAAELRELETLLPGKQFSIYNFRSGMWESFRPEELQQQLEEDQAPQFSLFPFHKLPFPDKSLVLTNGNRATPNLSDLENSEFSDGLFSRLGKENPVMVFDLHTQPTDFIRSLREFKVIKYAHGPVDELGKFLKAKKFPDVQDTENGVAIAPAGILISRTSSDDTQTTAPDHLLRLFCYNQVLKSIGKNYFNKDYLQEETIKEAALGNVVTPVSGLIVLETLEDYKRFEIEENKDSLGNAAIDASGAVPEPHEWALIILGVLFITWMWFFKGQKRFSL